MMEDDTHDTAERDRRTAAATAALDFVRGVTARTGWNGAADDLDDIRLEVLGAWYEDREIDLDPQSHAKAKAALETHREHLLIHDQVKQAAEVELALRELEGDD